MSCWRLPKGILLAGVSPAEPQGCQGSPDQPFGENSLFLPMGTREREQDWASHEVKVPLG